MADVVQQRGAYQLAGCASLPGKVGALQGVLDLGDVFVVVGLTTAFHVIKKNVGPLRERRGSDQGFGERGIDLMRHGRTAFPRKWPIVLILGLSASERSAAAARTRRLSA